YKQTTLWLKNKKQKTNHCSAIQIMTGVIHNNLGIIWLYVFLTQTLTFGKGYLPLALISGYPFWSSLSFVFSGTFAVVVEKKRSKFLVSQNSCSNFREFNSQYKKSQVRRQHCLWVTSNRLKNLGGYIFKI
uniref:Uncharacterized protein n=1 Tax=Urocitellus parryii TaxID=9999 RepID=A0A8D2GIV5_UROPR